MRYNILASRIRDVFAVDIADINFSIPTKYNIPRIIIIPTLNDNNCFSFDMLIVFGCDI